VAFLFVDRIYDYQAGKSIKALKNVSRNEGFFYWLPSGERVLSPAVITEALAQAGAWLKMVTADFKKRPVLLADERTTYHGIVYPGDQIDLSVEVIDFDDDVVVTRGWAYVNGKLVVEGQCCRGYMLPMEEFSDPEDMRRTFNGLYRPDLKKVSRIGDNALKLPAYAGQRVFNGLQFIDGLIEHSPYDKVIGFKNVTGCEDYFNGHFPHKPVVPGVMMLTFLGETCQYLIKESLNLPLRARALIPTYVENVRFRKFVEPGDQCILTAKVVNGDCSKDGADIVVAAAIHANDKRVMQATFGFRVMIGENSQALREFRRTPSFSLIKSPA